MTTPHTTELLVDLVQARIIQQLFGYSLSDFFDVLGVQDGESAEAYMNDAALQAYNQVKETIVSTLLSRNKVELKGAEIFAVTQDIINAYLLEHGTIKDFRREDHASPD